MASLSHTTFTIEANNTEREKSQPEQLTTAPLLLAYTIETSKKLIFVSCLDKVTETHYFISTLQAVL